MISVIEDGGIQIPESEEQFQQFMKGERLIHYVGMIAPPRPGVNEFISLLEHKHFKPGTPRNELFFMRIVEWGDIFWVIASIPSEDKIFAENIAKECRLRIADGIPTMISHKGIQTFPANNERVFTLENESEHPVYRNNPATHREILAAEQETVDRIHAKN